LFKVKEGYRPKFANFGEYFEFADAMYTDRELVTYDGDSASVIW